jgi:type VI secretion system protein ImpG
MSEALFPYYERELLFLRQLVQEFIRQYPTVSSRLLLEANRSADSLVERVLESFALLAGRVQERLEDDYPELTRGLLGVLYPHYLAPIPSLAIVQFVLDEAQQLAGGFAIARGSQLHSGAVENLPCKFRTAYPVTLWPVKLVSARLQAPPFPANFAAPPGTAAALRLQFECHLGSTFADLTLRQLRLYLSGDYQVVPFLYELLFNHALQVVFRTPEPDSGPAPLVLAPKQCLSQVGFERDDTLLPYPSSALVGYRVLSEFFTFPEKFLFVDLGGFKQAASAGFQKRLEVVIFLDRTVKNVEQGLDASTFRPGCVPVVNLFEQVTEPVALAPSRYEYRLVPDPAHSRGIEIYSVESVRSTDPTTNTVSVYEPFHSIRHRRAFDGQPVYWHTTRQPTIGQDDRGTEVDLHLVDVSFRPRLPAANVLRVHALCTNRDLPLQLQQAGEAVSFELEAAAPLAGIRCLRAPTAPRRPVLGPGGAWRLISHLNLNHLSLDDPAEGLAALQDVLRLYVFAESEAGQQQSTVEARQMIEGITSLALRRVIGRPGATFCRGIEVTVELDEERYPATGAFLFASVLERFLALYVSNNSFSQLVARMKSAPGPFKIWPPRPGEVPLV